MGEGVKDGDQAVDGVERKGGDGGDVAGGEEGGLDEVEEEERGSEVGDGQRTGCVDCCMGGGGR